VPPTGTVSCAKTGCAICQSSSNAATDRHSFFWIKGLLFLIGMKQPHSNTHQLFCHRELLPARPTCITRARSMGEVRPPKNHERRRVELSPRALEALRRQRAYTHERNDDDVLVNPTRCSSESTRTGSMPMIVAPSLRRSTEEFVWMKKSRSSSDFY
jgi:integrase